MHTRAALALFVALSVLVSAALAGRRYFYCPQMNEASLDACCARASGTSHEATPSDDGPAIGRDACCRTARFATTAPATFTPVELVLRAPLVAVVPLPPLILRPEPLAPIRSTREARAGPSPAGRRQHLLRVMVFLT